MAKNILSLKYNEALDFFMKSERFCNFELPEYINFDSVLKFIREKVGKKSYNSCKGKKSPNELENVSLNILLNKDGKYAVRPLMITNPYLYYFLVKELCNKKNWGVIKKCFEDFKVDNIDAAALPIIPNKKEGFHNSTAILSWWNRMEQKSIELSLEYKYMFVTDITNCYGTINPDTIDWALSARGTKYEKKDNHELAKNIILLLQAMQQGRNIGIPQGSILFDFVAEIILGYADLLLSERLEADEKITAKYYIIRYRDDYRVFCNEKDQLERISYILQQVLEDLNFRMNSQKTKISDSIVTDSIKSDKLFYIENTPIFNKKGVDFDGIQKHLLFILMFSRRYPNSGQLKIMLSDLNKRLIKREFKKENIAKADKCKSDNIFDPLKVYDGVISDNVNVKDRYILPTIENVKAISAILVQIAVENVSASHYALRVLSKLLSSVSNKDKRKEIVDGVYNKLYNQPNSTYTHLWLQNITYHEDKNKHYDMPLCKLVAGENIELWNNSWLKDEYVNGIPYADICNKKILKEAGSVITFRETRAYIDVSQEEIDEVVETGYLDVDLKDAIVVATF